MRKMVPIDCVGLCTVYMFCHIHFIDGCALSALSTTLSENAPILLRLWFGVFPVSF